MMQTPTPLAINKGKNNSNKEPVTPTTTYAQPQQQMPQHQMPSPDWWLNSMRNLYMLNQPPNQLGQHIPTNVNAALNNYFHNSHLGNSYLFGPSPGGQQARDVSSILSGSSTSLIEQRRGDDEEMDGGINSSKDKIENSGSRIEAETTSLKDGVATKTNTTTLDQALMSSLLGNGTAPSSTSNLKNTANHDSHSNKPNSNTFSLTKPKLETTGGDPQQDNNILKFNVTLTFRGDISRPKWESKFEIMNQLIKNFKLTSKKFAGPITVFLKNSRQIVIKGERESDFLLFDKSKASWAVNIFDKVGIDSCDIEKLYDDNPNNMLIGMTYDKLSPEGEKWIKKESRINKLRFRGGNRWDLRFNSQEARDDAKTKGFVQGGGVCFRLYDWVKQVNSWQCEKCCKWGHQVKECGSKKRICKYCAGVDEHYSDKCPYLNMPEYHKCTNCKNENGHHAGEKLECLSYITYLMSAHIREGIPIDQKYHDIKAKLEDAKKSSNSNMDSARVQAKFNEHVNTINKKLANQLSLNKEMLSNDDIEVNDYTRYCEEFIDEDVLSIYRKNKK
jgi:hypothetical protein